MNLEIRSPHFTEKSFWLLQELSENNNRDWYKDHRDLIETHLREPFAEVLRQITNRLDGTEIPRRGGPKTMFRMNRDVRFSKDKRPYRESVAALLTPSGTKGEAKGAVYAELNAQGGWAGGGFYKMPTKQLNVIRDHIVAFPDKWLATVETVRARGADLFEDDRLKGMPRGYEQHSDAEIAPWLQLKSLLVKSELPRSAWLDGSITEKLAGVVHACDPLIGFGKDARA